MSKCQCSIDMEHDSGPDFFSEQNRKARIRHKCFECCKIIEPGGMYNYESGRWEGDFASYKTCLDCVSLRKTFFCNWLYGSLWEDFREEAQENGGKFSPDCISLLTPVAKRKVLDIIKEIRKELHEVMDD